MFEGGALDQGKAASWIIEWQETCLLSVHCVAVLAAPDTQISRRLWGIYLRYLRYIDFGGKPRTYQYHDTYTGATLRFFQRIMRESSVNTIFTITDFPL